MSKWSHSKKTKVRLIIGGSGVGALAGLGLWWHRHGEECPYGPRWVGDVPRPTLSRTRLAGILRPKPGERMLEIGPGYGHYTPSVAQVLGPDGSLEILDVRQALLDQTIDRVTTAGLTNVTATRGDARRLPYPDRHFDGAYLVACLGEVPDRGAAIEELARVLQPGGRLVVGETAADPHRVRHPDLLKLAMRAGLRSGPLIGRVSYFARFDRPAS